MAKTLIIVESPTKAKKIQEYLSSDYEVVASYGHILDLPQKNLGFDLVTFVEEFEPIVKETPDGKKKTSKDTIKMLQSKAREVDNVILASDPDREGEAIAWHLQTLLKLRNYARIEIHEISKEGLNAALSNARKIHIPMVEAQRARRLIDRMYGYGISPVLSKSVPNASSAGRIQSAALHMIYMREQHIKNFKSEDRFSISVKGVDSQLWLQSSPSLYEWADEVFDDADDDVVDEKETKFITSQKPTILLDALKDMTWSIHSISTKETKEKPQPPLITSTMQRLASRELGWPSDVTMKHAQTLFENGLITYMRTDSVRISPQATAMGYNFIESTYGKQYIPAKPNDFKVSGAAQNAHEAIRPVYADKLIASNDPETQKLYALIHKRFIQSLMASAMYSVQTVLIKNQKGDICLKTTNKALLFDGWRSGTEIASDAFISIPEGSNVELKEWVIHEGKTKPKPHYNEDRMIYDLEKFQIGRPSTYASISKTLKKRKYIIEDKQKNYVISTLGEQAIEWFFHRGAQYIDLQYTAKMEQDLDDIEHHQNNRIDLLTQVKNDLIQYFNAFSSGGSMATDKQKDILYKMRDEGLDVPDSAFESVEEAKNLITSYFDSKAPSQAQRDFALKLAAENGFNLSDEVLASATRTKSFIDDALKNAKKTVPAASPKQIEMAQKICAGIGQAYDASHENSIEAMSKYIDKLMKASDTPPSEAQIKFAEGIATKKGVKYTDAMRKSKKLTSEFINKNK